MEQHRHCVALPMQERQMLSRIGIALDNDRPIRVLQGGIVVAREVPDHVDHGRNDHESEGTRRPPAGSRKGTARRERATRRSRASSANARLSFGGLRKAYQSHLADLRLAYPATRTWADANGMWLAVESSLLDRLDLAATFLVGLPFIPGVGPRAWGFWKHRGEMRWIGPRHTNFPDGSVCAFAEEDSAWREGYSLAGLVDLYSVWAIRHLFLQEFYRWPGRQYAPGPFYRLIEFKPGELCSCQSGQPYFECCRRKDQALDLLSIKRDFNRWSGGRELPDRSPPAAVSEFVANERAQPPSLENTHPKLS